MCLKVLLSLGIYCEVVLKTCLTWIRPVVAKNPILIELTSILSFVTMVSRLYSLFVTVVLASVARFTGAVGPVIRCEPCDAGSRMLCKPIPKDCAEKVREPGCGCCLTCALAHGQPCGIYTGRCGFGLTCQHQPGETKPLQALLEGRGICANATSKKLLRTQASVKENEGRVIF